MPFAFSFTSLFVFWGSLLCVGEIIFLTVTLEWLTDLTESSHHLRAPNSYTF